MRRGEIRVISSRVTGRDQLALILSSDGLLQQESAGWVITAHVDTSGAAPDLLVMVSISTPVVGVVRLDGITSFRKSRVGELVGRLQPEVMEDVSVALRAALDL